MTSLKMPVLEMKQKQPGIKERANGRKCEYKTDDTLCIDPLGKIGLFRCERRKIYDVEP